MPTATTMPIPEALASVLRFADGPDIYRTVANALSAAYADGEADNLSILLYMHNQEGPVFPLGRGRHKLYKRAKKQDIAVVSASIRKPWEKTTLYYASARALYPYAFDPEELRT